MAVSLNKRLYNNLKKGASAKDNFKQSVRSTSYKLSQSLLPKEQAAPANNSNNGDEYKKLLDRAQKDFDRRLNDMSKDYKKELEKSESSSDEKIKSLQKALENNNKNFKGFAQRSQKAFNMLQNAIEQKKAPQPTKAAKPKTEEKEKETETTNSPINTFRNNADYLITRARAIAKKKEEDAAAAAAEDKKNADANNNTDISDAIFKKVDLGAIPVSRDKTKKIYNFGDVQMKLTDSFGIRNWGARKGKHSAGIDARFYKDNKAVDYPVAIADGKIVKIGLHGSGKVINPSQGTAGGVYIYIQLKSNPNKIYKMAHLPLSFYNRRNEFLNTDVKRGSILIEDSSGSGSMTGPHIKYSVSDYNPETGEAKRNYSDPNNDPTSLFFTGKLYS